MNGGGRERIYVAPLKEGIWEERFVRMRQLWWLSY